MRRPDSLRDTAAMAAEIERVRAARNVPQSGRRAFDGARVDRLTASWWTTNVAIDNELRTDLDRLRSRSRDLAKNNEYGRKFTRMVRNNLVGPEGVVLQCRARDDNDRMDEQANRAIERAFYRWARVGLCEVTGRLSFNGICRLMAETAATDGEFLLREVRAGEYGYQLQLINVDCIDTHYNRPRSQGVTAIRMGVELDDLDRPIAYHLWSAHPSGYAGEARYRERVPAAEIIHAFIPLEVGQTRGVPWMHAGMRRVNDLNGYREAAVIAARGGAAKMGFFVSPDGSPPGYDEKNGKGEFVEQVNPGEFGVLPPGYDFKDYDPTYPHEQFGAFCKTTLQGIAAAWGVAYNSFAQDLEGVNFSSMRAGVIDERDEWMVLQSWFIETLLIRVFEHWLDRALMLDMVRLPSGRPLPANKVEKFRQHTWLGRRWQWVDPLKDITAAIAGMDRGLVSPQQIAAQTGRDIEEVLEQIKQFQDLVTEKGVVLNTGSPPPSLPPERE